MSTDLIVRGNENYLDASKFDQAMKVASVFAKTQMVPASFRNKPEDCFVVVQMAFRAGIDPFYALQNMYVVDGRPQMSSQMAIGLANRSGKLDRPITFEIIGKGNEMRCRASTSIGGVEIHAEAGMELKRNSGAWNTQPDQMLRYRSAIKLIRSSIPDAMFGLQTVEEWEDVGEDIQVSRPQHIAALEQAAALPEAAKLPILQEPANLSPSQDEIRRPRGRPKREQTPLLREIPLETNNNSNEKDDQDVIF